MGNWVFFSLAPLRLSAECVGWGRQLTVVSSVKPIQANGTPHGLLEGPVGHFMECYESEGSPEVQCMAQTCHKESTSMSL